MLAVAVGFVIVGVNDLRTSRRLAAEGRPATGTVLDKMLERRSKGRKSYYLKVQYQTEAGQTLAQRAPVNSGMFETTQPGATVPLHYLPTQPEVMALGVKVQQNWLNLLMSLVFFAIAGVYGLFGRERNDSTFTG